MMRKNKNCESGNTFLMVIIGIALFAALMFTLSRGLNESPSTISDRQAKITASDVISYSQQLGRAVTRIMQKGCSENDISFVNSYESGYEHTPAAPEKCQVFSMEGGRITYKEKTEGISDIIFNAGNYVEGAGSDCEDTACTDLAVFIKVENNVCEAINNALDIGPFAEEDGSLDTAKFTGSFAYADKITSAGGLSSACIKDTEEGGSIYYSVLYSR
jgi:hypothetical protein